VAPSRKEPIKADRVLEIFLILGVGWVAVIVLALALGRASGRADRHTAEIMESARSATDRVRPAPVAPSPAHTPPLSGSKLRVGRA
jgi:hypothetical protein